MIWFRCTLVLTSVEVGIHCLQCVCHDEGFSTGLDDYLTLFPLESSQRPLISEKYRKSSVQQRDYWTSPSGQR